MTYEDKSNNWDYLDFELDLSKASGSEYSVSVKSPAGEAEEVISFPFRELELGNSLKDLKIALLCARDSHRKVFSKEECAVQDFGKRLFDFLISKEVRSLYDVSRHEAAVQEKGLRLKLRIQPPELAALPWEFLYDSRQAEYICLSRDTPLVRYLDLPQPILPLKVARPLRILCMVASPSDLPQLNTEIEKQRVQEALKHLIEKGTVEISWLKGQTWRDLQTTMLKGPWNIFHFIGHGGFDNNKDEGIIALADENGKASYMNATKLGYLLADHKSLRLVVLNSCEGAYGSDNDIFSSTAAILVRRGIPAVLAMQYEITDRAAIEFARTFYESLSEGLPIDASVAEGRKAVYQSISLTLEWGVPVLYMRAPDGILFKLDKEQVPIEIPKIPEESKTSPSLAIFFSGQPQVADIGSDVEWTLKLLNDGNVDLQEVTATRDSKSIDAPFDLPIHEEKVLKFFTNCETEGKKTIKLKVNAVTNSGQNFVAEKDASIQAKKAESSETANLEKAQKDSAPERFQAAKWAKKSGKAKVYMNKISKILLTHSFLLFLTYIIIFSSIYICLTIYYENEIFIELSFIFFLFLFISLPFYALSLNFLLLFLSEKEITDLGDVKKNMYFYDKVIKKNPKYAPAWCRKGDFLAFKKNYDEAIEAYNKATDIDNSYIEAWTQRGIAFINIGLYDVAIKSFDKALKLDPNFKFAWYNKGDALLKQGKYDEAIKAYDEAIKLDPKLTEAWNNSAAALLDLKRYDEALQSSDKAIELDPKRAEAWGNKSKALKLLGRTTEADVAFTKAKELGYTG